ncbi:MAG TPA: GatB/YqeY domain-containing protein [Thiobacillaceae bacterium]|nr:GatB/YqeY domain-containing protein [Thiobacillaceae bacterium]HNA81499.1 GatB/YqeY domain-containing protein [Thiobacillaceae bacterium]HNF90083.1 GatB/YqeY domain-containing protein [Thiobacillaceae bacterium]HNI06663.1 GatB/YqeY domain-containing protein [Thiobacillaceae bacterium]
MTLKERINEDMKAALRAKETDRLSAIRLLMAAIKQREVDERIQLDDAAVTAVIEKLLKQRKDSAAQYEAANRMDLADKEKFEIGVLSAYMPQPLSAEDVAALVKQAVAETGAASAKDMGKVMAWLKPKLAGRADMTSVSGLVKTALG